ncbi:hypothetical protein, partial [Bifidobacterium phasiani]
ASPSNLLNSRTGRETSSVIFFTTNHDAPRLSHHTHENRKSPYASKEGIEGGLLFFAKDGNDENIGAYN